MSDLPQIWELSLVCFSLCNWPILISNRATSFCLYNHLKLSKVNKSLPPKYCPLDCLATSISLVGSSYEQSKIIHNSFTNSIMGEGRVFFFFFFCHFIRCSSQSFFPISPSHCQYGAMWAFSVISFTSPCLLHVSMLWVCGVSILVFVGHATENLKVGPYKYQFLKKKWPFIY